MKKILLSIFVFCGLVTIINAQTYEWTKQISGAGAEQGFSVSSNGIDTYTTGYFTGTTDFDPGSGTSNLNTQGGNDIFIQKLDVNGNLLWAKSIGGTGSDIGRIINNYGTHVIISGTFSGTVDFDPGAGVQSKTSNGGTDVFVLALDGFGNFLWVNTFGGTANESVGGQEKDAVNYITITGGFINAMTVPLGGGGVANLTATGGASTDVYVIKMVLNTGWINWAKSFGGPSIDFGTALTIKANKNILIAGSFRNTIDANPGAGNFPLSAGLNSDPFIVELDQFGVFVDAISFTNSNNMEAYDIVLDASNNVYLTGAFKNTTDFDPKAGVTNITSNGDQDCYLVKLNSNKDLVWAKTFGSTGLDQSKGVKVATNGDVYTAGFFSGTVDFDPSAGVENRTVAGNYDIFINKFNANGDFQLVHTFGSNFSDVARSLEIDVNDKMYVTGGFIGTVDFDPTVSTNNLTAVGTYDVFLTKYSDLCKSTSTDVQTACNAFTWIDGNVYTSSNNTATHTLTNISGCDSVVTLNLSINNNAATDVQTACNTYTWIDGNVYTSSNNTATHTLTNIAGCDSVVTLNLSINSNASTDVQTACGTYTWIDGNVYTSSNNTTTHTLTNIAGCDSVVTLNLALTTVDVTTTLTGTTIAANNTSATAYQWINCSNNSTISGAINTTYTPTVDGDYAVIVTEGACSDTSNCVTITGLGNCLVTIPDANFKAYLVGNLDINLNGDTEIQCTEATAFSDDMQLDNLNISDLTGIEAFTSLTELFCGQNNFTSIDISSNTALTFLRCSNNSIASLDLSNNIALTDLDCGFSSITGLDLSANVNLTHLKCNSNSINSLDLSNNIALVDLNCGSNSIAALNLSTNLNLSFLVCDNNSISSLNLSNHNNLSILRCQDNVLTSLNVANGNNTNVLDWNFKTNNNPNLTCVTVDDVTYSTTTWTNIDAQTSFNTNCSIILVSSITVQGAGGASTITTQGGTLQMSATVLPANATDGTYTWSVMGGSGSASIDANGLLTAITDGTVTVIAAANDASNTAGTLTITISNQTVGINEINSQNISIYPNPVNNKLFVEVENQEVTEMVIIDYSGRIVKSIANNINSIDVSGLTQGVYILKIATKEGVSTNRFIKNNLPIKP